MTSPIECDAWEFVDFDLDPLPTVVPDCELATVIDSLKAEVVALRLAFVASTKPATSPSKFLTAAEAAHHLRLNTKALYQRVARGQLKAVRLGRALRFRRSDLDALLR